MWMRSRRCWRGLLASHRASVLITLRQALALYADDLLVDEPYADWPVLRREQLRSAWRSALFEVADLEIESGNRSRPQVAATSTQSRSRGRSRLSIDTSACTSAGQINEALLQYERCVALLRGGGLPALG